MTVQELIRALEQVEDKNSPVFIEYDGGGGCDTCGYGSEREDSIDSVDDLGGKVWLQHS